MYRQYHRVSTNVSLSVYLHSQAISVYMAEGEVEGKEEEEEEE